MTTKKTKKEDSAKQKPKKAPATVKSAKADIEALGARFTEEIEGLTQRHKDLQASTAQDMEQLRTGMGKLEQFAGDVGNRLEAMEKQVGSLRETVLQEVHKAIHKAIQDAVQSSVRDAMDQAAKDVEQLRGGLEKMETRIQECAPYEDIAACRSSADQDVAQVQVELEAVRQSVAQCVSHEELAAHQGQISQDVGLLRTKLEKLNQGIEAYASQFQHTDQRLQDVAHQATAQQERVVALLNALEAEPWNRQYAELDAKLQSGLTAFEDSLARIQQDAGQVNSNVQEAAAKLGELGAGASDEDRKQLDEIAQTLADVTQRLDALENNATVSAVPAVAHGTTQPQPVADSPSPVQLATAKSEDVAGSTPTSAQEGLHKALLLWNGSCFTDPPAAVRLLSIALQYDPRNPELYNQRGLAHADAGEKDKAMADYGQALELDPSLPVVYHNRGLLAMKMNNKAQACDDFRSAAALGDDRAWNKARETGYCGGSLFKKLFRGVID